MGLVLTSEQDQLRDAVRRLCEPLGDPAGIRRRMETAEGFDPGTHRRMAEELGLYGLTVPAEHGGAGATFAEAMLVIEELGRVLWGGPYFATVAMAVPLLLACGDPAAEKDHLPGIASGRTTATVAVAGPEGSWDESAVPAVEAAQRGTGWALTGVRGHVIDGHTAGLLLVLARTPAGSGVFAVERAAPGVVTTALPALDQTRKLARVTFDAAPARLVGADGAGWAAVSSMLDLAAVALAAEQLGGAQRVLDLTVDYAMTREQFGRPIGSFQAIKHKCADMLIRVESARSAVAYARWAAAARSDDLPEVSSLAKAYCSEAFSFVAAEGIQIHGGIGFTWEHPAHLYLKRAKSSELLFGDPEQHRDRLLARIGVDDN